MVEVRRVTPEDVGWIVTAVSAEFASVSVVSRGRFIEDASALDGFVAVHDGRPIGCALIRVDDGDAELVVLLTTYRGIGAGTALLDAVVEHARAEGWRRLWLVTTNDNVDALRLYQRSGWELVALHRDAVQESRRIKPEIPERGAHGIPIRHELELEYRLQS